MIKIFRNIIVHKGIKLIYTCDYRNVQLFLNYNVKILQHEILLNQHS